MGIKCNVNGTLKPTPNRRNVATNFLVIFFEINYQGSIIIFSLLKIIIREMKKLQLLRYAYGLGLRKVINYYNIPVLLSFFYGDRDKVFFSFIYATLFSEYVYAIPDIIHAKDMDMYLNLNIIPVSLCVLPWLGWACSLSFSHCLCFPSQ